MELTLPEINITQFIINNILWVVSSILIGALIGANYKKWNDRIVYTLISIPFVYFTISRIVALWIDNRIVDIGAMLTFGLLIIIGTRDNAKG